MSPPEQCPVQEGGCVRFHIAGTGVGSLGVDERGSPIVDPVSDEIMKLASDFPPVTHELWLEAVDKVLKGRSFDDVLRSETADGIGIEPLYTADDAAPVDQFPAIGTSRRASNIAGLTAGWDVRQRHALVGTAHDTNTRILTDLARGVTSIELLGAGIDDLDTLDAILADVLLDLAPICMWGTDSGVAHARLLLDLTVRRGMQPSEVEADLGCDPIGRLAEHGTVGDPIDVAIEAVGALAVEVAATHPRVRTVRADGGPYASAGATPATELAVTVATGVSYLRTLVAAGLAPDKAMTQILLSLTVGTDQFGDMAKLRALRVMWARVADVVGVADHRATIQAVTASTTATRRDPWANMLRVTIGCFAAATGGADIVTVRPFDAMVGVSDDLGLRVARNTQLALMEESNLHRVIDPAGGSWYVEHLTDALAAEAWAIFQEIEREGGIVGSLRSGAVQQRVADAAQATAEAVATRRRPITGVSQFPNIDEAALERETPATIEPPEGEREVAPLRPQRLAEPFEKLRDQADAAVVAPTVFSANLGPVGVHTARASWAKNFFEAGGIRVVETDGFDDDASLAAAFTADPSVIAVICSSDTVYAERAATAATALKAAGARHVYLAGNPGDRRSSDEVAGVDEFVHVGTDVLKSLTGAHRVLGTQEQVL